jgi:hypothetical protein
MAPHIGAIIKTADNAQALRKAGALPAPPRLALARGTDSA